MGHGMKAVHGELFVTCDCLPEGGFYVDVAPGLYLVQTRFAALIPYSVPQAVSRGMAPSVSPSMVVGADHEHAVLPTAAPTSGQWGRPDASHEASHGILPAVASGPHFQVDCPAAQADPGKFALLQMKMPPVMFILTYGNALRPSSARFAGGSRCVSNDLGSPRYDPAGVPLHPSGVDAITLSDTV